MADTPVDQASFAELITRFQALIDQWSSIVSTVLVQEIAGAGPVALDPSLHGGKRLRIGNGSAAAAITVNLPAGAPVGTVFLARQSGAGPLKVVAAGGETLAHRLGHNGTAGQHAAVAVTCEAAGLWLLDGDTAAVS